MKDWMSFMRNSYLVCIALLDVERVKLEGTRPVRFERRKIQIVSLKQVLVNSYKQDRLDRKNDLQ